MADSMTSLHMGRKLLFGQMQQDRIDSQRPEKGFLRFYAQQDRQRKTPNAKFSQLHRGLQETGDVLAIRESSLL